MFFLLISVLSFFKIDDKRRFGGGLAYAASLFAFALALLAKTAVALLPLALALCAWWRNDSSSRLRREIIRTLPFF
jgi:4-amino-4-deoxy-L-arabinose transferase-like glycosyltransferase